MDGCGIRFREEFGGKCRDSFWRYQERVGNGNSGNAGDHEDKWIQSKWIEACGKIAGQNSPEDGGGLRCNEKGEEVAMAETNGTQITFLEAIKQAMFEEMERDPAVVLLGEDVGVYGGAFKTSEGLLERFGWERVIDTPISESAIIGAACEMSYAGLRPIAE